MKCIAEHSVDMDLFRGGPVLDVGCRNFDFSKPFIGWSSKIVGCDPDPEIQEVEGIELLRTAVVAPSCVGRQFYARFQSGVGNYLTQNFPGGRRSGVSERDLIIVEAISLLDVMDRVVRREVLWDIVKLDCEGSEYRLLMEWPGPIAGQITVEFHEHTGANPEGDSYYLRMMEHMSQWYNLVRHRKEMGGHSTENYWDSLFVLKTL